MRTAALNTSTTGFLYVLSPAWCSVAAACCESCNSFRFAQMKNEIKKQTYPAHCHFVGSESDCMTCHPHLQSEYDESDEPGIDVRQNGRQESSLRFEFFAIAALDSETSTDNSPLEFMLVSRMEECTAVGSTVLEHVVILKL